MGIRLLNGLISKSRATSLVEVHLRDLKEKRIAIDISIYMYRFKAAGALLEKIYLMCSIFRTYDIHPIFIFDGSPPKSKADVLAKRKEKREEAREQAQGIREALALATTSYEKGKLKSRLAELKRKATKLTWEDIRLVRTLLSSYGMCCMTADGEADAVCAALVVSGKVFACLSEDTDMFGHGCPVVLKYFSLVKHTVVVYVLEDIAASLGMKVEEFQQLCALSAANPSAGRPSVYTFYTLFNRHKELHLPGDYMTWAANAQDDPSYYNRSLACLTAYDLEIQKPLSKIRLRTIRNGGVDFVRMKKVLNKARFTFPPLRDWDPWV